MEPFELNADWVGPGMSPAQDVGFFVFRKVVELGGGDLQGSVRVSADQRYRLYVNGQFVGYGPQADTRRRWRCDPWELGSFLKAGRNVIQAVVVNYGFEAAFWQETERCAFLCSGTVGGQVVSTGKSEWEVARVEGLEFGRYGNDPYWMTHRVSPGERLLASVPHWAELGEGLEFKSVSFIEPAMSGETSYATGRWMVQPRSLPPMRYEGFGGEIRRVLTDGFRVPSERFEVAAGEGVLLDMGQLLTGFPVFSLSGEGVKVKAYYQEAMVDDQGQKGNRNETVGKKLVGYGDEFVLGQGVHEFEPFLWRTFRYIKLEADGPYVIEGVGVKETGYPLVDEAFFESDILGTKELWDIAIRTARRCARETYMDCPYYEELQYAGDTRIQALIGFYVSRDRRLQRNAVDLLSRAVLGDGLVSSRAPSREQQTIMPFHWFTMMLITDLVMHDPDSKWGPGTELTAIWDRMWQGAEEWMTGFRKDDEHGSWFFGDWVPTWQTGAPPNGRFHPQHVLTRQVVWDLRRALEGKAGTEDLPDLTKDLTLDQNGLAVGLKGKPAVPTSEHAEALRRYREWAFGKSGAAWPDAGLLTDRTTLYFSYYRHLVQTGTSYSELVEPWRRMIAMGLSTFPETEDNPRSDCHAWSAHPILGFMQRVAGVRSIAPGWAKTLVAPNASDAREFRAVIPHPSGDLVVERRGDRLEVESPVPCVVEWGGRRAERPAGKHFF